MSIQALLQRPAGIEVGDTITWRDGKGVRYESKVRAVNSDSFNTVRGNIPFDADALRRVGSPDEPDAETSSEPGTADLYAEGAPVEEYAARHSVAGEILSIPVDDITTFVHQPRLDFEVDALAENMR